VPLDKMVEDALLPAIIHWNQNHFVVFYAVKGKGAKRIYHIADLGLFLIFFFLYLLVNLINSSGVKIILSVLLF
jgi:hypothetical protein